MSGASDSYSYTDAEVLRNKLNIKHQDELQEAEGRLSGLRLAELQIQPLAGKFDLAHLQAIHKHIFQDVYDWAGKTRTIDISKGGSHFARSEFIYSYAHGIFPKMRADKELQRGVDIDRFTNRLAYYFGELNALHPFREGNGRSQREFLRTFALDRGFTIAWKKVDRDMMMGASIEAMSGHTATFAALLREATTPAPKLRNILERARITERTRSL